MSNPNLGTFLNELENKQELIKIKKELSTEFEIPAVAGKFEEQNEYPALKFETPKGYAYPVITNLFASRKRISAALGCTEETLNAVYRKREDNLLKPEITSSPPVQEVVIRGNDVDLTKFPIITHNADDAGSYITCGAMVVRDPETGIRNIGVYRHQLHGKNKLGIHMAETNHVNYIFEKYTKKGIPMPVSIIIGHHPAFYLGVLSFVPVDVDEYEVAGGMLNEPLEISKCVTNDLHIPSEAEIVIEGYITPGELKTEAPFGEYTTVYGGPHEYPVITVTAVTHRRNPLYLDCFSGHLDHQLLGGTGRLSIIYKTARIACPTVQDVFMPPSGCCRMVCYVSIKKRHEGEAKNVISAVFASDPFVKYAVVVDDDVNIFDDGSVIKAIATRLRPAENGFIIRNAKGHPLDPTAADSFVVTKIGIDATKPMKDFPKNVSVPGIDAVNLSEILGFGK